MEPGNDRGHVVRAVYFPREHVGNFRTGRGQRFRIARVAGVIQIAFIRARRGETPLRDLVVLLHVVVTVIANNN